MTNLDGDYPLPKRRQRARTNGHDQSVGRLRPITLRDAATVSLNLDRPYVVKRYINRREISFWYGPSTCGKTFLLQHVFRKIAINQSVLGQRVRGGPVIYFSMEPGSIEERLYALKLLHGDLEPGRFIYAEDTLNLYDGSPAADQIVHLAQEHSAAVVVIDPISAAMAGANENDYTDVSLVIDKLRHIAKTANVHVACVAHTGKDTERGQRGSSHFYASGDFVVSVSDAGGNTRTAEIMKARDARKGDQFRFRLKEVPLGLDSDGDEIKTLSVEMEDQSTRREAPSAKLNKGDLQALGWLREAIDEYGQAPPFDLPAGIRVTTKEHWAEIARKRTGDDEKEANRKAISRAITNLSVARMIGANAPFFWVVK